MSRKQIDGKTVIHRRQYSVFKVVMLTFGGAVFVTLGITLLINEIESAMADFQAGKSLGGSDIFMSVLVLLLFIFGGIPLFLAWKDVYHSLRKRNARKCGEDGFAVIVESFGHSEGSRAGANVNRCYGFVLRYEKDGEEKTFKTDAVFEINEYKYLTSLDKVKVKIYKNYVVIDEEFRYEIYKRDSRTGLDKKYFTEKPYSTIYNAMRIATLISLILTIVLFAVTVILKNEVYFLIGFGLLFLSTVPLGIVYACYFFGSGKKKK